MVSSIACLGKDTAAWLFMCADCPKIATSSVALSCGRVDKRVAVIASMKRQFQEALSLMPFFVLPDPLESKSKRVWEIQCYEARSMLRTVKGCQ